MQKEVTHNLKRGTPKTSEELSVTYGKGHYFEKITAKNILEREEFIILPLDDYSERLKDWKRSFSIKYHRKEIIDEYGRKLTRFSPRILSENDESELGIIEKRIKERQSIFSENQKKLGKLLKKSRITLDKNPRFFDYFCKKDSRYYLIDAKLKQYTNHKYSIDRISVSPNQILYFNKISKNKKLQTKILLGLERNGMLFYRFFNWTDFFISHKFNPLKRQGTTIKFKTPIKSLDFHLYNNIEQPSLNTNKKSPIT